MRRGFLARLLGLPALGVTATFTQTDSKGKILIKSAWGSADPTQASFAFLHANAFAEADHPVQIFLLGEAVSLMRTAVASSIVRGRIIRPPSEYAGPRDRIWVPLTERVF